MALKGINDGRILIRYNSRFWVIETKGAMNRSISCKVLGSLLFLSLLYFSFLQADVSILTRDKYAGLKLESVDDNQLVLSDINFVSTGNDDDDDDDGDYAIADFVEDAATSSSNDSNHGDDILDHPVDEFITTQQIEPEVTITTVDNDDGSDTNDIDVEAKEDEVIDNYGDNYVDESVQELLAQDVITAQEEADSSLESSDEGEEVDTSHPIDEFIATQTTKGSSLHILLENLKTYSQPEAFGDEISTEEEVRTETERCGRYGFDFDPSINRKRRRIFMGSLIADDTWHSISLHAAEAYNLYHTVAFIESNTTQTMTKRETRFDEGSLNWRMLQSGVFGPKTDVHVDFRVDTAKDHPNLQPIIRENLQREHITRRWKEAGMQPDDIGIICDIDEVFTRDFLLALQSCDVPQFRPGQDCFKPQVSAQALTFETLPTCQFPPPRLPYFHHPNAMLGECIDQVGNPDQRPSVLENHAKGEAAQLLIGRSFLPEPNTTMYPLWTPWDFRRMGRIDGVVLESGQSHTAFHFHNFFNSFTVFRHKYKTFGHAVEDAEIVPLVNLRKAYKVVACLTGLDGKHKSYEEIVGRRPLLIDDSYRNARKKEIVEEIEEDNLEHNVTKFTVDHSDDNGSDTNDIDMEVEKEEEISNDSDNNDHKLPPEEVMTQDEAISNYGDNYGDNYVDESDQELLVQDVITAQEEADPSLESSDEGEEVDTSHPIDEFIATQTTKGSSLHILLENLKTYSQPEAFGDEISTEEEVRTETERCGRYGFDFDPSINRKRRRIFMGSLIADDTWHSISLHAAEAYNLYHTVAFIESNTTQTMTKRETRFDEGSLNWRMLQSGVFGPKTDVHVDFRVDTAKDYPHLTPIIRENLQREHITRRWKEAGMQPDDIGIICDIDEVFTRDFLLALQSCDVPQFRPGQDCYRPEVTGQGLRFEMASDCSYPSGFFNHPDALLGECIDQIGDIEIHPPGIRSYAKGEGGQLLGARIFDYENIHLDNPNGTMYQLWKPWDVRRVDNIGRVYENGTEKTAYHFHNFFNSMEVFRNKYKTYGHSRGDADTVPLAELGKGNKIVSCLKGEMAMGRQSFDDIEGRIPVLMDASYNEARKNELMKELEDDEQRIEDLLKAGQD